MNISESLSSLFVLPFLLFISIPLALSASITAFLALATLFIRALVVYFELSIALAVNFFLFPAHSPASGSFLTFSEATTPAADRPPARTKVYSHHYQTNFHRSANAKAWKDPWHSREVAVDEDYFFQHSHYPSHSLMSPHEVLSSFVSGNAERDFEGVGGWRTPIKTRKKHQTLSASSGSYKSSDDDNDDEVNNDHDEQAWVSINKRLELPSRHFNFAPPTAAAASPAMATAAATMEESIHLQRPRFHRRSVTTPLLPMQSTASAVSAHPASSSSSATDKPTQLQTSKSSAGLQSLASSLFPRPSTTSNHTLSSITTVPPSWYEAPFLMTPTGFGIDYKMVHYPSFVTRRRRSSGGSSVATAAASVKGVSPTGLGLS